MRVDELRRRIIQKLQEVAARGDEESMAKVLDHSRAVLLAVASRTDDDEVDLAELKLTVKTAASILGVEEVYVQEFIRRGYLQAQKENDEYGVPFSEVVNFQSRVLKIIRPSAYFMRMHPHGGRWMRQTQPHFFEMWRRPPEEPQVGTQMA